ncbi:Uncharacterized protein BP5553_04514 [Venustampulla echinocandica]|uniref:Rad4-domain-containing protein n=1 Tax=Venustampulla echinocandica TaxID=2656787 RepID=A0A370TNI1_9HELO|nr:Uncharacterized protein BP5553_04514 [Venustampulla echinocandica]RDL37081.1 Uncharacterized protein BP5553_04514 [Venustampulla echinocandica]
MLPKRRGRPPKIVNESHNDIEEIGGGVGRAGDSSAAMTARKATTGGRGKGKGKAPANNAVPEVYRDMLDEALPAQFEVPERPLKKRRVGPRGAPGIASSSKLPDKQVSDEDDDDIQFEDVLDTGDLEGFDIGEANTPAKEQQTAYRDLDEESDDNDFDWDGVDFENLPQDQPSGDLELTLNTIMTPQPSRSAPRRRLVSKAEKVTRLEIHRMHILCLLSHVSTRNDWCNDSEVQSLLRPLLNKKVLSLLRPKSDLSQFGRTESLKRGLEQTVKIWKSKFSITARGMRRALWADDEKDLQNYKLAGPADLVLEKLDFRAAAKTFKGSRDLGAQLYCALLRSAGLDVRLICSLQPLSFNSGGPPMPPSSVPPTKPASPEISDEGDVVDIQDEDSPFGKNGPSALGLPFSPRRRLGHPNAADYNMPDISAPVRLPPKPKPQTIQESPYPVFWVEVLDEAHQKWFPVDPLVTEAIAKPRSLEPPAADRENMMSYVIAFEEAGNARDVTRRYAKAFNAKTRKNRIEPTPAGKKWWSKTMRAYSRDWTSDLDQIEDIELTAIETREPMPKNIADFKDHPVYALERHLKKNEILVATRESGKVAAGRDSGTPGRRKLENVYRRRDVKIARSADAWYRLGRDIKMGEQPVKVVAAKRRPDEDDMGGDVEERPGTNLFTEDQTEIYAAPPVVNGRVPKNSFGNIDVYVPSMVPKGGVHIPLEEAARAARLLGVDYADALTGFEFRGRHGTAVLKGVVVAAEYHEAVEAVIEGFRDERAREQERMRILAIFRMWKRFLFGLRIKKRVDAYAGDDEEAQPSEDIDDDVDEEDDKGYVDRGDDDESEGGFLSDEGGGGFFHE